ncbi:hypothetical protein SAMN05192551_11142 [Tindallia magadiensis]|uniref:Uncharacterized protein n=1 Tax=Tindallia magadiensis TaxID=69895 RepID=A0A1I3H3Y9_9FIRM|nr:hypothetical protein [Tindallia magadiensis]SFI30270.1 hypothetical protein SAMN05192551_11142 [Tindallia magadiensis]
MRQTKTQKNFHKEMKQLKDNEIFNRNIRNRTVTFHEENRSWGRRHSLVRIVMVLWSTFALMTWILPVFGINPYSIFNHTRNHPNNALKIADTEMVNQEIIPNNFNKIVAYIDKTSAMEQDISSMMNQLSHIIQSGQTDPLGIQTLYSQVENLKRETFSNELIFSELNKRNQELLNIVEAILLIVIESEGSFDQHARSQIDQHYREMESLINQRLPIMIRLFQENNIQYTLNEDGSMTYSPIQ